MNNQHLHSYFLPVLLIGVMGIAFFVFRPFFYVLILAVVCAVVFQPLHQKVLDRVRSRQGVAALFTTLIIVISILVPLVFLGLQIFKESQQLYSSLVDGNGKDALLAASNGFIDEFQRYVPSTGEFSIHQYIKEGLSWLLQNLGAIFSNIAKLLINIFIFLMALYYLLKDGKKLKKIVIAMSPLADTADETILKNLEISIQAVIKGSLTIALIQGVLTTVGFIIFGVPNAVLWGTVAAVAALIPGIGTAMVLIPAVIFLFLTSTAFSAFGLLVWGILAVGLIDNVLGPKLVGREMQLHPLIVFLSVIGGLLFFGPIGFLLGPITASLLLALLNMHFSLRTTKADSLS